MRAAVLRGFGAPVFGEAPPPSELPGSEVVAISASAVNPIDVAIASGKFYTGPPALPSVVGEEGVGVAADGRRVYFCKSRAPHGAMAELSVVSTEELMDLPAEISDEDAIAFGNAGLAAWLALTLRAKLEPGESVLVLGASGTVGRIAIQLAQALHADVVIAASRSGEDLAHLGATRSTDLGSGLEAANQEGIRVDVIVDLLWGPFAVSALSLARYSTRYVQVGNAAGPTAEIPAALIRPRAIQLLGHANFATPIADRRRALVSGLGHLSAGQLKIPRLVLPLSDVAEAWSRQTAGARERIILRP